MHLLENNFEKTEWCDLSVNTSAIQLSEKYLDKINWEHICQNPGAVKLLEKYPEKCTGVGYQLFQTR